MPFIDLDGNRLYWERRGPRNASSSAIFLHDGMGSVRSWKDLPERICGQARCRAFLYDRAGYGRSPQAPSFRPGYLERESRVLSRFLDRFELPRVHLVGHSDGASIALIFASRHPDRVKSLTVIAPHTFVEEEARIGIRELLAEVEQEEPKWLRKQHGGRGRALLEAWSSVWLSNRHASWDIRPLLKTIRCPILVVQGSDDEFGTLAQVEAIVEALPNSKTWIVPGGSHKPHIEEKEEFALRTAAQVATARSDDQNPNG